MRRYTKESTNPKSNAQRALSGRTHYVDPDTLTYHKSRILRTFILEDGLIFGLIESVALDPDNRTRGCRSVLFDIFGTVLERNELEDCVKTRKQAEKAMWADLETIDAKALTLEAIARFENRAKYEADDMRKDLEKIQ